MSYLVMETHPGYAVVLSSDGRFLKVVNFNYEVGEKVETIYQIEDSKNQVLTWKKKMMTWTAIAACFVMVVLGGYQYAFTPIGTVQMTINPDIKMEVNRMDHVIGLEGLNEDGKTLIEDVNYFWKDTDVLVDELADKAEEMGYLKEGKEIRITVESEDDEWKQAMEDMLILELEVHFDHQYPITKEYEEEVEIEVPMRPVKEKKQSISDEEDFDDVIESDEDDREDRTQVEQEDQDEDSDDDQSGYDREDEDSDD